MLAAGIEVVDGTAVRYYQSLESPLVAQDIGKQTVAAAAGLAFICVVCAHNLLYVSLGNKSLECGQIGLPEVTLAYAYIKAVTVCLQTAVNGVVLGAGMCLVILGVVTLHTFYKSGTHLTCQIRVLTAGLLTASPTRITEDVDVGAPERESLMPRTACSACLAELVVVRCVPMCAGLIGHNSINLILLGVIKCCSKRDCLREYGSAVHADTVAGLRPPVVGRNAKAVNRDRTVHHQTHLLLGGKQ